MPILQSGNLNTTALTVPDDYIQIVPPNNSFINGSPTNLLGFVGSATWGPVNSPVIVGSLAQYVNNFGAIQTNKYDMGTHIAVAALQGANNFVCVRVTDGTDVAATITVVDTAGSPVTGLTATAIYTGTVGNTINVTVGKGSNWLSGTPTYRITVSLPGGFPEIFDNIGGTGATFWTNAVSAINNGLSSVRGPSQLIVATIGTSTAAPAIAPYTLASGVSGNTTLTSTVMMGSDTAPRSGLYALRNTGVSVIDMCDLDTSTTWTTQISFGLSEGAYMIMVGPSGQTPASATTAIQTAGIDSYAGKLILGDWCYWVDAVNNQTRLISPQGFVAGLISTQDPSQSSLNKQLYGIVGTQKSSANQTYSAADLQAIALARCDVITNPLIGRRVFGVRFGRSTSSNSVIQTDNYTRMTNYLASSFNITMNQFVGVLQTPTVRLQAKNAIQSFLQSLVNQGLIGNVNGGLAYQVILDSTNNPQPQIALGYMQADIKVIYFSIIQYFIVNIQGGSSVTITNLGAQPLTQNI